jgi:YHS domain-containing protein
MSLKEYMTSCLVKFNTLKMKGIWETPSPEQEQIIVLTAAVTSLKSKGTKHAKPKPVDSKRGTATAGRTPRKDEGSFAWKTVAPKEGEPKSKVVKGKTYYWCTNHTNLWWALHNPDAFTNMCRNNPKYAEMEFAHNGSAGTQEGIPNVGDMRLQDALATIEDSESQGEAE